MPGNRVYWQWAGGSGMPAIEFIGVPFMFVGSKRLVCHQGKDLAVAQKQRYAEERAKKTVISLRVQHTHRGWLVMRGAEGLVVSLLGNR